MSTIKYYTRRIAKALLFTLAIITMYVIVSAEFLTLIFGA